MSVPTANHALKEYLMNHDAQFRALANEHHKYEKRLTQLSSLLHPNQKEQQEESLLKKKKLLLKDKMEQILHKFQAVSH